MTGIPDVEDYFEIAGDLNITSRWTGSPVPSDYSASGQLVSVNNEIADPFSSVPDARAFYFEIYSGQQPDARESWDNFLIAAGAAGANSTNFRRLFRNNFGIQHGIPHDPDAAGSLGDFETLYQALGAPGTRNDFRDALFENAMTYFLINYDFTIPIGAGAAFGVQRPPPEPPAAQGGLDPGFNWQNEFKNRLLDFFQTRASLDEDLFHGALSPVDFNRDLAMYESLFNEFVVQPPIKPFDEVLAEFYNKMIERDGVFLPSHQLADWVDTVQEQQAIQGGTATSVAGTNSQKTAILLILFRLLVEVIQVLQKVAAAQGERLRFYAGYQKAYTELLREVPIINEQDVIDALGSDGTENRQAVMSFTQAQNQSFTEKVRSFRSVIGDEAKQHQTTVNQSNEIVTQQANLGTSILQQLSTILTNLFK